MAFNFSPKIVTNGLVLALDAANTRSYVSGSTVWRDLTANSYSGSLVNGPTFNSDNGGSIAMDGVDDLILISTLVWQPTKFSVCWFLKPNNTLNYNQNIQGNSVLPFPSAGWGSFVFHTDSNGSVYVGTDVATRFSPSNIPNNTVVINTYQMFCFTFDSGAASFYKNNRLLASKTGMTNPVPWSGFYWSIYGNLPYMQIYNRALSAAEILQNYNALKGRFNLT